MKILLMGGTRFVGKALLDDLIQEDHEITVFTRGNRQVPENVRHIKGDRDTDSLKLLEGISFDVIVDSSGRKLQQTKRLIDVVGRPENRFIYISSAGVYADNELYPYTEKSIIDINSRHYGKVETEKWLNEQKIRFTSFRPTYIYGPGNYNPIENWFFSRIRHNEIVPMPGDGQIITQLGHVKDLAEAIRISLNNENAINKIYNCSGKQAITIKGIIETAARVCNIELSNIKIKSFDYSNLEPKARKIFPIRLSHFFTDISLIEEDLNWTPKYSIYDGLLDSYQNDYLKITKGITDFSLDSYLLQKVN